MIVRCRYDSKRDIKHVSPTGYLNLKDAFANNSIPAGLQVKDSHFNGISDPDAVGTRATDAIDAEVISREHTRQSKVLKDAAAANQE